MHHQSVQKSMSIKVLMSSLDELKIEEEVSTALKGFAVIPTSIDFDKETRIVKVDVFDPTGEMSEDEWMWSGRDIRDALMAIGEVDWVRNWSDAEVFTAPRDDLPYVTQISYRIITNERDGHLVGVAKGMEIDYKIFSEFAIDMPFLCVITDMSWSGFTRPGVHDVTVCLASNVPLPRHLAFFLEGKMAHRNRVKVEQSRAGQLLSLDDLVQLNQQGRITIPKSIRNGLGIKAGDTLSLSIEDGRLVGIPVSVVPRG